MDNNDVNIKNKLEEKEESIQPRLLTGLQILTEETKEIEYIFHPWLNVQGLALIFAERGVGKTHVSLNSALAIITGGEYLGWYAPSPRKVLFIDGEMQFPFFKKRFIEIVKMNNAFSELLNNINVITPDKYNTEIPDLATIKGQLIVNQHLEETKAEVLFIDNISCLMPSLKSNDNDYWRYHVQSWILNLRKNGIAVVLINHAGKSKKDEPLTSRGASGKEDVLDSVISLQKPADYQESDGAKFKVEFKKHRNFWGNDALSFEAHLTQDKDQNMIWNRNDLSNSTYDMVCKLSNQYMKQIDIAKTLKISKGRVSQLVKKGISEKKIIHVADIFVS